MGLKVPEWDAQRFDPQRLFVDDVGERPSQVIQAARLGIPKGATNTCRTVSSMPPSPPSAPANPLRRGQVAGRDYHLLGHQDPHLQ